MTAVLKPKVMKSKKAEFLTPGTQSAILKKSTRGLCRANRPENLEVSSNSAIGNYKIEKKDFSEKDFNFPHLRLCNHPFALSSSQIRQKIAEGGGWRYLVSEGVFEYIKKRELYGFKNSEYR